jgi:hypothetical protein
MTVLSDVTENVYSAISGQWSLCVADMAIVGVSLSIPMATKVSVASIEPMMRTGSI